MRTVLVCGGRDFTERARLYQVLDELDAEKPIGRIIHGGARGADRLAGEWAKERGCFCTVVPAQWDRHGKSAGYRRNEEMARMRPDLVVAFPGGRGTAHMVDIARRHELEVEVVCAR